MLSRTAFAVLVAAICTALAPGSVPEVGETRTADYQFWHDADLDVACLDITVPPQTIDFDSTFVPQIQVRNNRYTVNDVPIRFVIVRASDLTDTIYHDTAHTGPIGALKTKLFNFTLECTPDPGLFTMTGITELPGDTAPHNDTCSKSLLVRFRDVVTDVSSPGTHEEPGLVDVRVKLTNVGSVPAMVPRVDVSIRPSGYHDYLQNIAISVGGSQSVTLCPWVCPAGCHETCTAWITYPADSNHSNDTDVVFVNPTSIQDRAEMGPHGGTRLTLWPSPLAGNALHIEYALHQAGPASVTLFDVSGRPVAARRFVADRAGELPLDLRFLIAGVYVVRLDDG